ncbi:MAG: polysaccharide biosynthesis/export family protein, partial [Bacteroidota bacterium]
MKFPIDSASQDKLSRDVIVVQLGAANIGSFTKPGPAALPTTLRSHAHQEYQIGPGDVISIFVFDHPELAIPTASDSVYNGFLVQSDGSLSYPFIGSVAAKGKTVEELRAELEQRLARFFPAPQVDVRIAAFNAQRVVVGGEVRTPNTQPIKATPLTLLEALNAAGGLTEQADPRAITLRRGGVNHRVDLDGFLSAGLSENNPALVAEDVVSVPRKKLREAYLLGEVQTPATINLSDDSITLTQAITRQGGINEARADARGVFVFRDVAGKMTVYQLDTSLPTALLLGARFTLEPGDVVYITKSPLQRWNDTVSRLLPSVAAV